MSKTKLLTLSPGSRYLVPIGAVATAGLIGANMLCPMSPNDAMAANLPVSLTKSLASEIELSIGGEGMGVLTPGESAVDSTVVNRTLTIGLTNSSGYSVQLSAEHAALQGESDSKHQIPGITTASTLAQMPSNTWGYSIDGTNYHAPSTEATTAYRSNSLDISTKETKTHTLRFAAKVDADTPADTYSNTVYVSVVSEPRQVATFAGLTMQQVTPTICKQAAIHETAYLRDERDNNYYWITKLKDGNCWMSQNLALDLTKDVPVEGSIVNTDGTVSAYTYTPEATTLTSENDSARFTDKGNRSIYSWNEGKYVIIDPNGAYPAATEATFTAEQGGLSGFANLSGNSAIPVGGTSSRVTYTVDGVEHDGIVADVTNWTVAEDPNFTNSATYIQDGNSYNKTAGWAIDPVNKVYDAHYLVGNYYQWHAATAQTETEGASVTADGAVIDTSICPTGWRLPLSKNSNNEISGSFYDMLKDYGNLSSTTLPGGINATDNIAESPLFFARSGIVSVSGEYLNVVGNTGSCWSSVVIANWSAYNLLYNQAGIHTQYNYHARSTGRSVRCLVLSN